MIIVLDLDDTLYDERQFVISGYKAVAKYIKRNFGIDEKLVFKELMKEMSISRSNVFDRFLRSHNILTKSPVNKCLMIYRKHKPDISLYTDALEFLKRHKDKPLYIVTDGNWWVQKNKVKALNLDKYITHIYYTWQKGRKYAKPSIYFFNKICSFEKVLPSGVLYIGDDPNKDFVNIKKYGFQTIRLLRGRFAGTFLDKTHEASLTFRMYKQISKYLDKHSWI